MIIIYARIHDFRYQICILRDEQSQVLEEIERYEIKYFNKVSKFSVIIKRHAMTLPLQLTYR